MNDKGPAPSSDDQISESIEVANSLLEREALLKKIGVDDYELTLGLQRQINAKLTQAQLLQVLLNLESPEAEEEKEE